MKVSAMIELLTDFIDEHGNLEVMTYDALRGSVHEHPGPQARSMKIKKGREYLDRFWYHGTDEVNRKGPDVCHL